MFSLFFSLFLSFSLFFSLFLSLSLSSFSLWCMFCSFCRPMKNRWCRRPSRSIGGKIQSAEEERSARRLHCCRLVSLTLKCISSIVAANSLFDSCVVSSHKLDATLPHSHASDGLSFLLCKCSSFVSGGISSWIVDLQVVWGRQEGGLLHEGEESQTYRFCSFTEAVETTNTEMNDSRDIMIHCYQRVESW